MTTWAELAADAADLAAPVAARIDDPAGLLLATLRADGWPRVTPVRAVVAEGRLLVEVAAGSAAAADLQRDPRCLLHGALPAPAGAPGGVALHGRLAPAAPPVGGAGAGTGAYEMELTAVTVQPPGTAEADASRWAPASPARGGERRQTVDLARAERGEPERRDFWRDRRMPGSGPVRGPDDPPDG